MLPIARAVPKTFPAFALPLTDTITSIKVYVRHKQPSVDLAVGTTTVIENTGDDISAQNVFFTTTIVLPTSAYTIVALNAGGTLYDLLYNASIPSFPLIFPETCPYVDVDEVVLEVITSATVTASILDGNMFVIPNQCTKVIR